MSAIAYGVGHMNGAGGLEGWRWLFIIEGVPSGEPPHDQAKIMNPYSHVSVVVGILVFIFLPSYPKEAKWLTAEEKDVETRRLGINSSSRYAILLEPLVWGTSMLTPVNSEDKIHWKDIKATLTDWRLYVHYLAYTAISPVIASLSLFSPVIVAGMGYQDLDAQLFTVPPYAVAYVITLALAFLSDRLQNRGFIAAASFTLAGITFCVQGKPNPPSAERGNLLANNHPPPQQPPSPRPPTPPATRCSCSRRRAPSAASRRSTRGWATTCATRRRAACRSR